MIRLRLHPQPAGRRSADPSRARFALRAALAVVAALAACSPRTTEENAVRRGDEAFAQGNFDEALAEYRLAVRQGADDPEIAARVAHTYAQMGRVDDAGAYYKDATAREPELADQAVSDLMRLAKEAQATGDRFAMATAVETALELRPGVGVADMALPLARHYFVNGEYGRALPFYQRALAGTRDSLPAIVFEVGQAYEEIGDCEHALLFFERFRTMVRPFQRGEVDWYIGTCAFNIAGDLRRRSTLSPQALQRALDLVNRTVEVGEPRNIQAQAWFEKGEILAEMGDCQAAMEAYAQVRYADQAGSLVDRAQSRFDEIRFGTGLEHLREGRCR
jgi:tetratricopeptide (TPR) repeat protein